MGWECVRSAAAAESAANGTSWWAMFVFWMERIKRNTFRVDSINVCHECGWIWCVVGDWRPKNGDSLRKHSISLMSETHTEIGHAKRSLYLCWSTTISAYSLFIYQFCHPLCHERWSLGVYRCKYVWRRWRWWCACMCVSFHYSRHIINLISIRKNV